MAKTAIEGAQRGTVFFVAPEQVVVVDTPGHPLYDERVHLPVSDAMVQSIIEHGGNLQPVQLRKNGSAFEVVFGRQRTRAVAAANALLAAAGRPPLRLKVEVVKDTDIGAMSRAVAENEIRRGDDPITQARKLDRFIAAGATLDQASSAFGVSIQTIANRRRLLDLADPIQDAVREGTFPVGQAMRLAVLPREQQMVEFSQRPDVSGAVSPRITGSSNGNGIAPAEAPAPRERLRSGAVPKKRMRNLRELVGKASLAGTVLGWVLGEVSDDAFRRAVGKLSDVNSFQEMLTAERRQAKKE